VTLLDQPRTEVWIDHTGKIKLDNAVRRTLPQWSLARRSSPGAVVRAAALRHGWIDLSVG
jgi:hypothetical protein